MGEVQALAQRGGWTEALARVAEAEGLFPPGDANTLLATFTRGQLLLSAGRYREAERPITTAIAGLSRFAGVPSQTRFLMTATLGMLYQRQTRWVEAEELYTRAVEDAERLARTQPTDPSATDIRLVALGNLGMLYTSQGRYAEGEALLRRALDENERAAGDQRVRRLLFNGNLAANLLYQRRFDEAERLFLEAQAAGPVQGSLIDPASFNRNNLAQLYVAQDRYADAEPLLARSLAERRALGEEQPDTILAVGNLADLYRRQGRLAEAEPLFVRALAAATRVYGEDHLISANFAAGLALVRLGSPATSASAIDAARQFVAMLRALRAADPSQVSAAAQRLREQGQRAYGFAWLCQTNVATGVRR